MKILIRSLVSILVFVTDVLYRYRPYPRFYVLEQLISLHNWVNRQDKFSYSFGTSGECLTHPYNLEARCPLPQVRSLLKG